ncbi:MAG: hypothetical protein WBA91_10235 [Paracoccaceae bacterium]
MLRRRQDNGFVLVGVILVLAVLAAIALSLSSFVRLDARTKAGLRRQIEMRNVADGLVRGLAWQLTTRSPLSPTLAGLPTDATEFFCKLDGDTAAIRVAPTSGLIDLNIAPLQQFERLLRASGLSARAAGELAGAIGDFRDADDTMSRGGGSERQSYASAGLAHRPKNAPFETVAELDQVLGMSRDLFLRLRPLLTVHSYEHEINAQQAPLALLALLVDDGRSIADPDELRRRYRPLLDFAGAGGPPTFSIEVTVTRSSGVRYARQAVVEASETAPAGYVIREWTQFPSQGSASPPSKSLPGCLASAR